MGAEVLGQLHGRGAAGPGRPVHEEARALADIGTSQMCQRLDRTVADRRTLLEGHPGRQVRQRRALPDAREFRVRAEALDAEDPIADLELGDGCTDSLDLAGKLQAEDPRFGRRRPA